MMKSQANHKQQTSIKQEEENEIEINCKKTYIYVVETAPQEAASKQEFFSEKRENQKQKFNF